MPSAVLKFVVLVPLGDVIDMIPVTADVEVVHWIVAPDVLYIALIPFEPPTANSRDEPAGLQTSPFGRLAANEITPLLATGEMLTCSVLPLLDAPKSKYHPIGLAVVLLIPVSKLVFAIIWPRPVGGVIPDG